MNRFPTFPRCSAIAAALLCCAVLPGGCSAAFFASSDETTDRLITELSQKTETAVVRADAGQLSADDRDKFFSESIGTVRTLKARSALFAKNEDEIAALAQLEQRFEALQQHGGQPRSSTGTYGRLVAPV